MPELFPQSPALVGDVPDAVPEITMSRKSQSVADKELTVNVRCVPIVSERRNIRLITDAPAQVNVPLMVWLLNIDRSAIPVAGAVIVKLLKVFAPVKNAEDSAVDVKDRL